MKTREQVLAYGLSFPNTYQDAPFHDLNWQLVRVKNSKKDCRKLRFDCKIMGIVLSVFWGYNNIIKS